MPGTRTAHLRQLQANVQNSLVQKILVMRTWRLAGLSAWRDIVRVSSWKNSILPFETLKPL